MPRATPPRGLSPRRRITTGLLILLFLASLPAVTTRIYASDEVQYFAYLRSLWFDHDVSFENEYQYFYDHGIARSAGFHETFLERTTETGRRINFGTIGCALLWTPFYAAGDVTARLLRATGHDVATDGYSAPYVAAVSYASALYGFLGVLLSAWLVRAASSRWWPALGVEDGLASLAVWLGTPLLFYMYVAPPMSHATSAFSVAAFLAVWFRVRASWSARGLAVLGALAALMTMVREQDAFFAAAPAIDFGWTLLTERAGRRLHLAAAAVAGIVAAAFAFLPQALAYLALNGHVGPSGLVSRKMSWSAPHALEVLSSPQHGFLIWTPLAVLSLIGLFVFLSNVPSAARPVAAGLVAAALLQIYVAGSVESWTVAGAFGQRRFISSTALLVLGLASVLAVVREAGWQRATVTVLVAGSVWWNLALMVQFGAGWMNRQRLEPASIAYNTFVVVPRALPQLAWRYFANRSSFYQSRAPGTR